VDGDKGVLSTLRIPSFPRRMTGISTTKTRPVSSQARQSICEQTAEVAFADARISNWFACGGAHNRGRKRHVACHRGIPGDRVRMGASAEMLDFPPGAVTDHRDGTTRDARCSLVFWAGCEIPENTLRPLVWDIAGQDYDFRCSNQLSYSTRLDKIRNFYRPAGLHKIWQKTFSSPSVVFTTLVAFE